MVEHPGVRSDYPYITVTVEPSRTHKTVRPLRAISSMGVPGALGPYDIVVELETKDQEQIAFILREKVRSLRAP